MKLISSLTLALSVAAGAGTWQIVKPLIAQNGSSVIYAASDDGKAGGKPLTKQYDLLNFAYAVAKEDGLKYPQYLQGIIMQESKAGDYKGYEVSGLSNKDGDHYFGIAQLKLAAAKDVVGKYPEMWKYLKTRTDEELQARLILDDQFNIRVASKYALMMGINQDPSSAITKYNQGPTGAAHVDPNTHPYTVEVKQHASKLNKLEFPGS
jgi:hypothetical protein